MAERDETKLHEAQRRSALRMALVLAAIAVVIYLWNILSRL
jgi:hypothetical protein